VFEPNYHGSTGYGDEVTRAIIGHNFEKDVEDIVSGIEALKKRSGIGKVAVMGWIDGINPLRPRLTPRHQFGV
jgi:dipeptidyl aminopeptidase/acylaminoacyl peptidase